ncbi:MAG: membrane protein insertase YidC, partial [Oscillospiraceae bacterium]|nr:membrane protein insertase YidC [Oscillospiraceae bacterium]
MNPFKILIMRPMGWLLLQLYQIFNSYGVALIIFSILIKLVLLPLSMKAKKSSMKMSRLSPRMKALEKKYGSDKQRYQQAVMDLYHDEGVSTTGGCLWGMLPMLILLPLFYMIRSPLTYMFGLGAEQVTQIVTVLQNSGIAIDTTGYYYQISAASQMGAFMDQLTGIAPNLIGLNFNFLGVNLGAIPDFKIWSFAFTWANIGLFL